MTASLVRLAFVLGLLTSIGPFAIDMYLPALPAIGAALRADVGAVQASLMVFFVAFGLSQIVFGPASDIFGRKAPLYLGIALFVVGSVGCAMAPDVGWLIAFRALQGLGGGAPMVVPRAIVRDRHTGVEATRLMSLLMLVFSVSPILAPLIGSLIIDAAGWRAIFWTVTVIGLLGFALTAFGLEETRPPAQRHGSGLASTWRAFGRLLRDRHFMALLGIGGFGIGSFFVYLANSSFVLIDGYGLTPRQYGLAFAANAISFFGASQLSGRLAARHGLVPLLRGAVLGYMLVSVVLALLFWAGVESLAVMVALLMGLCAFLGLLIPVHTVLALDAHGEFAGAASALMGTLQMLLGAVLIALLGPFATAGARPMLTGMALCSLVAFTLTRWTFGRAGAPAAETGQPLR